MNLEERIKKGMIFYETEHKSIENQIWNIKTLTNESK